SAAPGGNTKLAEACAANMGLGMDDLAERGRLDLAPYPTEMIFPAALITEREHDARLAADVGDRAGVGDGIGDGLVEKHMFPGGGSGARCFEVHIVGRRVDNRL